MPEVGVLGLFFAIATPTVVLSVGLFSAMGFGDQVFSLFADNHDYAMHIAMATVALLFVLYLLDVIDWRSEPHSKPGAQSIVVLIIFAGFSVSCLFYAKAYPPAPMCLYLGVPFLCFHAVYKYHYFEREQQKMTAPHTYFSDVGRALILAGVCTAVAWLLWVFADGNWWDTETRTFYSQRMRCHNYDTSTLEKVELTKRACLAAYLLWVSPFITAVACFVFGGVSLLLSGSLHADEEGKEEEVEHSLTHLKTFTWTVITVMVLVWVMASVAGAGMQVSNAVTAFCGVILLSSTALVLSQIGPRLLAKKKMEQEKQEAAAAGAGAGEGSEMQSSPSRNLRQQRVGDAQEEERSGEMGEKRRDSRSRLKSTPSRELLINGYPCTYANFPCKLACAMCSDSHLRAMRPSLHAGWSAKELLQELEKMPIVATLQGSDWVKGLLVAVAGPFLLMYLALSVLHQQVRMLRGVGEYYEEMARHATRTITGAGNGAEGDNSNGSVGQKDSSSVSGQGSGSGRWGKLLTPHARVQLAEVMHWHWTSVLVKAMLWGLFFVLCNVGIGKCVTIFFSWLRAYLKNVPLGGVLVIFVAVGILMFLLPPVPGVPVYVAGGLIIPTVLEDKGGLNFWFALFLATLLCLLLKLVAIVLQQKVIGEQLGTYTSVKCLVAVNSSTTRSIQQVLSARGFSMGKVAILCGGPDWPTSVLTGILGLPVTQMLLGSLPVYVVIAPCVMTGAFMTIADSEMWKAIAGTTMAVTVLVQVLATLLAMYFIEQGTKVYAEEISMMQDDEQVAARDRRSAQKGVQYRRATRWGELPLAPRFALVMGTVAMVLCCYVLQLNSKGCFREFVITDSIEEDLDGNWVNIVKYPAGYGACCLFALSIAMLCSFWLWLRCSGRVGDGSVEDSDDEGVVGAQSSASKSGGRGGGGKLDAADLSDVRIDVEIRSPTTSTAATTSKAAASMWEPDVQSRLDNHGGSSPGFSPGSVPGPQIAGTSSFRMHVASTDARSLGLTPLQQRVSSSSSSSPLSQRSGSKGPPLSIAPEVVIGIRSAGNSSPQHRAAASRPLTEKDLARQLSTVPMPERGFGLEFDI